jgi:hypothetical protein
MLGLAIDTFGCIIPHGRETESSESVDFLFFEKYHTFFGCIVLTTPYGIKLMAPIKSCHHHHPVLNGACGGRASNHQAWWDRSECE